MARDLVRGAVVRADIRSGGAVHGDRGPTGGGHPAVVVDMTRTRFCESSAIHTLLRAHKRAAADGGELRLVIPAHGPVPRIMTLTCMDRLIPCFASLAEAVAGMPSAAARRG